MPLYDPEERRQARCRMAQFLMACAFGSAVYLALSPYPENPKVPLFGGLIAGFGGSYAVTFAVIWARYGWRAARSMRMG